MLHLNIKLSSHATVSGLTLYLPAQACDPDARPSIDAVVSQLAVIDARYNREPQPITQQQLAPSPGMAPPPSAALDGYTPADLLFAAAK